MGLVGVIIKSVTNNTAGEDGSDSEVQVGDPGLK